MSTFGKVRERSSSRKVTPPTASYMSNDQFANYLADLRNTRISRPGGARPLPPSSISSRRDSGRVSFGSRVSIDASSAAPSAAPSAVGTGLPSPAISSSAIPAHQRSNSDAPSVAGRPSIGSYSVSGSISSRYTSASGHGRDYYPDKAAVQQMPQPLRPDEVVPTDTYMERGQRWMEKEEVVSLRHALEDMDLTQLPKATSAATPSSTDPDDQRIYNAALDEAAELVWQHQNGVKAPVPGAPYQYKQHLRKNSYAHARTASVGRYGDEIEPTGLARDPGSRSVSGSSASSLETVGGTRRSRYSFNTSRITSGSCGTSSGTNSARHSLDQERDDAAGSKPNPSIITTAAGGSIRSKAYSGIAGGPRPMASASTTAAANSKAAAGRRRSSMKRNISGEIEKPFSGDQIYEEPETATPEKRARVAVRANDSILQNQPASTVNSKDGHSSVRGISKLVSRYEIHRNPPSQSRNPLYTTNDQPTPPKKDPIPAQPDVPRKNGIEIRGDDIRQATSMKLKDRNPKLPTPSYVSDTPGRPIVSFDTKWKAPVDEAATDTKPDAREKSCYNGGSRNNSENKTSAPTNSVKFQPKNIFARRQNTTPTVAVAPASDFRSPPAVPPQQLEEQQQHQQPQQRPQARNIFSRPSTIQVNDGAGPSIPTICATEEPTPTSTPPPAAAPMPIPTISVSEESPTRQQPHPIPTIVLPGDDVDDPPAPVANVPSILVPGNGSGRTSSAPPPIIVTPDDNNLPASSQSRRPLPPVTTTQTTSSRPLPAPAKSGGPNRAHGHWSRAPTHHTPPLSSTGSVTGNRATARCHECRHPIEGRFISLAGLPGAKSSGSSGSERFHPQCFRCYSCGTSLEALEISPEPDEFRNARLERIARRACGEILEEARGETMGEDGDDRLRFYCHLDWHELFAPRCKHCTTPIVGEHVVALGAHWHVGHFFCAECGDPFGSGATHIEKDGYAWCVSCQTKRTERRAPKCRACGKAVIGQYVQALAAEWHDDCFRCSVCRGGFSDGQIFPREGKGGLMQVVCTGCRQRELKA